MITREECIRFLTIGVSNTILGFSLFHLSLFLLPPISFKASTAQVISYVPAVLWSYFWNSRWTFKQNMMTGNSFARFIGVQLLLIALSILFIGLLVDLWRYSPTLSWIAVMSFIAVLNFLLTKYFVFSWVPCAKQVRGKAIT